MLDEQFEVFGKFNENTKILERLEILSDHKKRPGNRETITDAGGVRVGNADRGPMRQRIHMIRGPGLRKKFSD